MTVASLLFRRLLPAVPADDPAPAPALPVPEPPAAAPEPPEAMAPRAPDEAVRERLALFAARR